MKVEMTPKLKKAGEDGWLNIEHHAKWIRIDEITTHWWNWEQDILPTIVEAINYLQKIHYHENAMTYTLTVKLEGEDDES